MNWEPRPYQRTMVKWLVQHPEAALLCDPGLGKTSCTLAAFQALRKAKVATKMLVVAPLRVCENVWTHAEGGELSAWSDFKDLRVELLHGKDKDEAAERDADVYVINYDGIEWLINSGALQSLIKRGVGVLVFDELSRLKHTRTKRFKLLKSWLGKFPRRWGLTGSPASNGLMDLFGQVYALDLGRRLGPYITHYRSTYFDPTGYGGYDWKPKPDAEKRIYGQLKDLALSMRASDHLDLPPLIEQDVWVTMPAKAMTAYRELEDDLVAQLDNGTVTAANSAVASGKCRQVASGGVYVEYHPSNLSIWVGAKPDRKTLHVHDEKTEALKEIIDELQGQPAMVFYQFEHDLERIRGALGNIPALHGGQSSKSVSEAIRAWNAGETSVLAAHPASAGHGLNLQGCGCSHVIFYSLPWDEEHYDQAIRRVYRQGTTSQRVIVHRILARKTVDIAIAQALQSKQKVQNALMDALKKHTWRKS